MPRVAGYVCIVGLLLAVGCTGAETPPAETTLEVRVEPQPEQNLYSISRVVLEDVAVSPGVLDRSYPGGTIGAPCVIVEGTVRNMDPGSSYVTMFAYGYNRAGKRVAATLDVGEGIPGQITVFYTYGESGPFTLHLDASADIESVRLFAFTWPGNQS